MNGYLSFKALPLGVSKKMEDQTVKVDFWGSTSIPLNRIDPALLPKSYDCRQDLRQSCVQACQSEYPGFTQSGGIRSRCCGFHESRDSKNLRNLYFILSLGRSEDEGSFLELGPRGADASASFDSTANVPRDYGCSLLITSSSLSVRIVQIKLTPSIYGPTNRTSHSHKSRSL
jgi:hypothetical protein